MCQRSLAASLHTEADTGETQGCTSKISSCDDEKNFTEHATKRRGDQIQKFRREAIMGKANASSASPPTKLSNRCIFYAVGVYFVLPLSVLRASSQVHGHLLDRYEALSSAIVNQVLSANLLLLGFSSLEHLWTVVSESFLSASCFGITFLLVRKGLNPETRQDFLRKGWRGAILTSLSVFYSAFAREVVKLHSFPRRVVHKLLGPIFSSYVGSVLPRAWTHDAVSNAIYHSLLAGLSWAAANMFIRRRLDPAMRENLFWRHWKDVTLGSCALFTNSLAKLALKRAVPEGKVEGMLACRFGIVHDNVTFSAVGHLFGFETQLDLWHWTYEAFKTGSCWGLTYLFIRRGLNPETGSCYLRKYWRDAVFGSVALFCCVFLKLAVRTWVPIVATLLRGLVRPATGVGDEL